VSDPCARVEVAAADGAVLVGCAHGGQVLGWTPAGTHQDRLWVSPAATCGHGAALRGGVPVIFPRFSATDLPGAPGVPRHGLARDRSWELAAGRTTTGAAQLTARLRDDAATAAVWPHRFTLTLTTVADGTGLEMTAIVRNDGDQPFAFMLALHTYLAVSDAATATVHGLAGRTAVGNDDGATRTLPPEPVPALGPTDLALPGALAAAHPVRLVDPVLGDLELTAEGLDDLVAWNPGPDHGLADVPPGGASSFVCLEAARLSPLPLAAGRTWSGSQHLRTC
jgi:glucose-6-phosphate 1-epimerase